MVRAARDMHGGNGIAEEYHLRWFEQHLPESTHLEVIPHRADILGLSIAGVKSRELLANITDEDVSQDDEQGEANLESYSRAEGTGARHYGSYSQIQVCKAARTTTRPRRTPRGRPFRNLQT